MDLVHWRMEAAEKLKAYVIAVKQANALTRMDGHTTGFSLRYNTLSVDIAAISAEFLVWTESSRPDKKLIKQALAQDRHVDGPRLAQTISLVRR